MDKNFKQLLDAYLAENFVEELPPRARKIFRSLESTAK